MCYRDFLEIIANWAAILTAGIATFAYGQFVLARRKRRKALEDYLREEKLIGDDQGRRSTIHLMANLGMTEAEVLQAGFSSSRVRSVPGVDDQGRANRVYFEYDGEGIPLPQRF